MIPKENYQFRLLARSFIRFACALRVASTNRVIAVSRQSAVPGSNICEPELVPEPEPEPESEPEPDPELELAALFVMVIGAILIAPPKFTIPPEIV